MDERLKKLRQLSDMMLQVELAKLHHVTAAESRLAAQVLDLEETARRHGKELAARGGYDTAIESVSDGRWADWREKRTHLLNMKRATLRASIEDQKDAARRAFGKTEALGGLAEKLREADRIKRLRQS